MTRLPACLLLSVLVAGCAASTPSTRFPSLLPRAIETRSEAEPVAAPVVIAPDPASDAKIVVLRKSFDESAATFSTAAAAAERQAAAAKGDAVGGERWIAAQTALADLDALRANLSATLTEIDDIAVARATAGDAPYPALEALRDDVETAAEAQTARIAAIQARLPSA